MVDDEHGDGMASLQLAQVGEQRGDLAAGILVDAVQPHERIEDEQARLQLGDGLGEAPAVEIDIEPHGGCGDHLDIEIGKLEACGGADALEPPTHDIERVLGGIEQDAAWVWHREAAQARRAGGDRDGEVEGEERLAALGLAADDADCLLAQSPVTSQRLSSARSARR